MRPDHSDGHGSSKELDLPRYYTTLHLTFLILASLGYARYPSGRHHSKQCQIGYDMEGLGDRTCHYVREARRKEKIKRKEANFYRSIPDTYTRYQELHHFTPLFDGLDYNVYHI